MALLLCLYSLVLFPLCVNGWIEWNYTTQWDEDNSKVGGKVANWQYYWGENAPPGLDLNVEEAPRPRKGHSLQKITTETQSSEFGGAILLVMFGGRDNEAAFEHIPRTYNVANVNGSIEFTTYDRKPVTACNDPDNEYYSVAETAGCNFTESSRIRVGVFYNDVWAYRLCPRSIEPSSTPDYGNYTYEDVNNAERYFDGPCEQSGWLLFHPGAPEGGCVIQLGVLVCSVPSERYSHAAAMFDDGLMYVYGGFSQRCADYCDDLWVFDVYQKGWKELYSTGTTGILSLSFLYQDLRNGDFYQYSTDEVPLDSADNAGPGRRWRSSFAVGDVYNVYETTYDGTLGWVPYQQMAIFGGHRLWHGFSAENSESNDWSDYTTRPSGGYLDDLWIYTKWLDFVTNPGAEMKQTDGKWQYMFPKEECVPAPGISWDQQDLEACSTTWPSARAGHGIAFDTPRNGVWIFGGYGTYYPYLKTDGEGSAEGVSQLSRGGFIPYPGYSYYKNDLWFFNITSGYWTEYAYNSSIHPQWPEGRVDHVFLLLAESAACANRTDGGQNCGDDLLFVNGGYADNFYFEDTWYYNISTGLWLEKERFVYAQYPSACTDDEEYVQNNPNCIEASYRSHLERDSDAPHAISSWANQPNYWPDSNIGPYFGVKPKYFNIAPYEIDPITGAKINTTTFSYTNQAPWGTPLAEYSGTGPGQYVQPFTYQFNATHSGTVWEYCTSVYGEPTRGKVTDGQAGRADNPVWIPQMRRQRPGWDGCDDRHDNRTDLPLKLTYRRPRARSAHAGTWIKETKEIFIYGGLSYKEEQVKSTSDSFETVVRDDMWYFGLYHCLNNCSDHGICTNGFCKCFTGYYGEDCSNVSCPGTSCYYDEYTNDQVCVHACQAGYNHTDNDVYVPDINKLPCSRFLPGETNGICDGFGTSQCAPPFIGDDCGTRDCKSNCSFNGWCSVEYPVSRCMCQPGYYGEICEFKICLNNCSYPNGVCNPDTGFCNCRDIHSPFNMTRTFKPWAGEDCSWMFAYAAGSRSGSVLTSINALVLTLLMCIVLSYMPTAHSSGTNNAFVGMFKPGSASRVHLVEE